MPELPDILLYLRALEPRIVGKQVSGVRLASTGAHGALDYDDDVPVSYGGGWELFGTLDWLESPALRRRCHAGLNKSEQRHFLAQVICTFKQGRIADRGAEAQQFRASRLRSKERTFVRATLARRWRSSRPSAS